MRFDEVKVSNIWQSIELETHSIRCRYALRFGSDGGDSYDEGMRDVDVRIAFNSPFRPFVLASTSVGQEGLDFHQYCHRVVHWNLPANPVDLEQREGRIHRYKGHVIRRNLAKKYGLDPIITIDHHPIDPWEFLFELARKERSEGVNDLVPYWIFEDSTNGEDGTFKIERMVPVLPLSREIGRLKHLISSLVAYRAVIGQPRQEELLGALRERLSDDEIQASINDYLIDLSPPTITERR